MCGILAILGSKDNALELRSRALKLSKKLRHRGPDWNGIYLIESSPPEQELNVLAHERLAIVDLQNGAQPLTSPSKEIYLCVNGEIYNHLEVATDAKEEVGYKNSTNSDCECIIPLYMKYGSEFIHKLDGIFAFILYDKSKNSYLAARDPIGVCPMYIGWHHDGSTWFASEMKALVDCTLIKEFPPGHYWSKEIADFRRWYNPIWLDEKYLPTKVVDYNMMRETFEKAVIKRMMTDVPFGVLLSGGLDSSLIASIVSRYKHLMPKQSHPPYNFKSDQLLTFSIGLKDSPDLEAARRVAHSIESKHYSFEFTIEEGIDALHDVISHIETYDVTTVRASTPMFLLARRIKALGVKVVLSGEGSDEIFGGYLYFHKAPSSAEFHRELIRKVTALSKYDCLRANKATAAWGIETRVPFLDRDFLDVVLTTDAEYKLIQGEAVMEKFILRKAFDDSEKPYLPDCVLWRQKEQFSDGVGHNWIDSLKDYANRSITDKQFKLAPVIYPFNTPTTKEAYLYRTIFDSIFKKESCARTVPAEASIACSTAAALEWDEQWKNMADPSGRGISVHGKEGMITNEFFIKNRTISSI